MIEKKTLSRRLFFYVLSVGMCLCAGIGYAGEETLQTRLDKIETMGMRYQALSFLSGQKGKDSFFRVLEATSPSRKAGLIRNVAGSRRLSQLESLSDRLNGESMTIAQQVFALSEPNRSIKLEKIISFIEQKGTDDAGVLVSYGSLIDIFTREILSENLSDSPADKTLLQRLETLKKQASAVSADDTGRWVETMESSIAQNGWFDGTEEGAELLSLSSKVDSRKTRGETAPKSSGFGLPDGFLWGVSTSGYQWEGSCNTGCWPPFEAKGKTADICKNAADGFHRYDEDVSLAAGMGCNAFRTSIEWARIEPQPGVIDPEGVAFYHNLFASMKKHGITPVVTLVHFSWPAWIETKCGGWQNTKSREAFGRYVEFVAKEYGSEVDWWMTFNEPLIIIASGYVLGGFPPGQKNPFTAARVTANWIACHKLAYKILHQFDKVAYVSFNNYAGTYSALGADLIFFDMKPGKTGAVANLTAGQHGVPEVPGTTYFENKNECLDYIALDYYCRWDFPGGFKPAASWEIYPQGFAECLKNYWKVFKLPVLVAENGMATENGKPRPDGWTREAFLVQHVKEMQKAIDEGVPVIGYLHWSITDNYELGTFDQRFGLYSAECKNGDYTRVPTPAVDVYKKIIAANGVTPELLLAYPAPVKGSPKSK
ncbi:MAG: glycoside hydrolase family 1 protein [Candidatus Riflebacteria bacterium]|nr:glycoside hydrolase family 1 protein [Candidatus Riflebacteria bacterium]